MDNLSENQGEKSPPGGGEQNPPWDHGLYLDRRIRNDTCSFRCCCDRDKPVKQYGRQTGIAKKSGHFLAKTFRLNFFR